MGAGGAFQISAPSISAPSIKDDAASFVSQLSRPKKSVTPSLQSTVSTSSGTPLQSTDVTAAPAPGSPEAIADVIAKLAVINPGDFETSQAYTTASENLRDLLRTHKELQKSRAETLAEEGPAYRATITHIAEVWGETDKESRKETRVLVNSDKDLTAEIERLKLRLPSANLWDAQEKAKADALQAIEDAKSAEEKRAELQKKRDANVALLQSEVDADNIAISFEKTRPLGLVIPQYPYGQPGSDAYKERVALEQAREDRVFELMLAEGLAGGKTTDEQAREMRTSRWAKRMHDEGEAAIKEGKRIQANNASWRRTPQPGDPRRGDFLGFVDEHGKLIKE
jgi:hypothetical protein